MYLADLTAIAEASRESGGGFAAFRTADGVIGLGWPDDVAEQWLYDHSDKGPILQDKGPILQDKGPILQDKGPILQDYGDVDLSRIRWDLEALQAADIAAMPTGPSEHEIIDEFAGDPEHWISVRDSGVHLGVAQMWELHGTWKRWPVLIDRRLLEPSGAGLQVVVGRTRVGILKGRLKQGAFVAERHLAWVGRPGL